jgi:hypothetical protein
MSERPVVKIIAHIPAEVVRSYRCDRNYVRPAKTIEFCQDEKGHWTATENGLSFPLSRSDVIGTCKRATNWPEIRREHFWWVRS